MHTILGVNGVTGSSLARHLRAQNISVRGVSRRPFPGDWEHVVADVLNPVELISATAGSKVVYLLVGLKYDIAVWRRDWPVIMENTINACLANNAKLVFLDNVYALGLVRGPMKEDTPHNPCSKKGEVRARIAETLLDAFKKGLPGCMARSADFYGPHCATSILNSTAFERQIKGKSAFIFGKPDKIHTFTYTHDIGPALAKLGADDRANGQIWHIPTTKAMWTGADWVKAGAQAFGVEPKYQATPTWILRFMGLFNPLFKEFVEMNYQYTHDYVFNSDKFEQFYGIMPTPPETGVAETAAYYKEQA